MDQEVSESPKLRRGPGRAAETLLQPNLVPVSGSGTWVTFAWQERDPAELAHLQMGPRVLPDCRDDPKLR